MRAASRIKAAAALRSPRAHPVRVRVESVPVVAPELLDRLGSVPVVVPVLLDRLGSVPVVVPDLRYGEFPAAMLEDSMAEGVVKGKPATGRIGRSGTVMRAQGEGGRNDG